MSRADRELSDWLRRLLRPIARFALDRGMKHPNLVDAAKLAFLDVARDRLRGQDITISRLSVLTGLQRYEVKRLLEQATENDDRGRQSLVARVLARWATEKRYLTNEGRPRVLGCDGKESEFAALVGEVSQAMNPYTVLFEIERLGLVTRSAKGLRLESPILIDSKDRKGGMRLLEQDSSDLFKAVGENLFRDQPLPNLHIRTEYDDIPASALPRIRLWILKAGTKFHERVQQYLSRFDRDGDGGNRDSTSGDPSTRIVVTTFSVGECLEKEESHDEE